MSVHRVWVKLYRHHVVLFTTSFPHQTKTKKAVFMITLWSNVHVAMLSHDVVSTIWEWVQSGNESNLGMSPVWEWVQSGNESSLGMSPDTDTEWTHILPWFLVTLRLPVFLLSHPHLMLSTCLDLQCPLGTSWPGLCCRWVVNCYHWKLVIGSHHETYLLIYTSRSSVSLHCLFAHIASFPVAYNLTCSLEMYISLHAVFPSTIRWVVHLSKSIFLPVG